jgi:hypothetical protein
VRRFALFTGILLILLALLARVVGIDHDARWGASRYILLYSGLALTGAAALVHLYKTGRFPETTRHVISNSLMVIRSWLARVLGSLWISIVLTAILLLGITTYAAWYTSFGMFPRFTRVVNYYVNMGEAFLHGQVALLIQPEPQLVALANPYDSAQRENVTFQWDLSYYKGKYYAYWGPAPALLYAAVEALTHTPPPDQMGVLVFYSGLSIVLAFLLFRLRQMFFPRAPGLSIPLFLLAALANLPIIHILERCQVYETSAVAGQFFLFLGLLAWLRWHEGHKPGWLIAAGLSWGLAIGTRYNLAITVAVLTAFALYRLWKACGFNRAALRQAAALLAPLALSGLALALYNYARFESPFETGLVYQLTIPVYQNRHFSPGFVWSNLYLYLFYPLATRSTFPFFPSIPVDLTRLPAWAARAPGNLSDEVFFGIGQSLPVLWMVLAIAAVAGAKAIRMLISRLSATSRAGKAGNMTVDRPRNSLALFHEPTTFRRQLAGILILAGFIQFIFLLFYYFASNRFIIDFLLLELLGLVFLAWEADELLHTLLARGAFWGMALLLILATALIGVLAGFDIVPQFFRLYNPALYQAIAGPANRNFAILQALPDHPGLLGAGLRLLLRMLAHAAR